MKNTTQYVNGNEVLHVQDLGENWEYVITYDKTSVKPYTVCVGWDAWQHYTDTDTVYMVYIEREQFTTYTDALQCVNELHELY